MDFKKLSQIVDDKKIIIVLLGVLITIIPTTSGYFLPKTHLELYVENELIIFGKVIDSKVKSESNQIPITSYDIKILQHVKGNTEKNQIIILGLGALNSTSQVDNQTILSVGQELVLFLNQQEDGNWFISPYSFPSDFEYLNTQFILSPLKLYKSGIPGSEIQCKSSLKLAFKSTNESPVCLTPETFDKLSERKWIK